MPAPVVQPPRAGRGVELLVERLGPRAEYPPTGEHLLGLINDVLDLSKFDAGEMRSEAVARHPCLIISEVASFVRVRASKVNAAADSAHRFFAAEHHARREQNPRVLQSETGRPDRAVPALR